MPARTDPRKKIVLVLKSDQDLPPAQRPEFHFRQCVGRVFEDVADKYDAAEKGTGRTAARALFDLLRDLLTGWDKLLAPDDWSGPEKPGEPIAFDPSRLEDLLLPAEVAEL